MTQQQKEKGPPVLLLLGLLIALVGVLTGSPMLIFIGCFLVIINYIAEGISPVSLFFGLVGMMLLVWGLLRGDITTFFIGVVIVVMSHYLGRKQE